ncbi:DNA repair protein RecO C-terminal domain-containing protein [Psychrobacter sp. P11G5]|uniref:DNA repair protein RecO n=1 Tax=Psychrobacter sp. P11G5 TaxID=1699624 RepID=UPI00078B61B3|nr:DNA repair protein RecO C-terminal domain-containing protein [Psychrobacter sp. P11G5]AMN66667.1 DNA recombination protein RecO [Psychrobacter sp. P11G5]
MRNEALIGYLLHQRAYQEKRALYYLFSEQHGVVHGIGKKGAPLFEPLQLFATGKRDLKTFSQINLMPAEDDSTESATATKPSRYQQISGQQQYAALYLNEILWKLLPSEDPMPVLWQHYQNSLLQLKQPLAADALRLCLRQFESHLFEEIGFSLTLTHDNILAPIEPDTDYRFLSDVGFVATFQPDKTTINALQTVFSGADIIKMAQLGITDATLSNWSRLHRHLIDHLLDYQPLQSRLLWQQQQRYQ